jgi:hypothetical protein
MGLARKYAMSHLGHERPGRAGSGSCHVRFAPKATIGQPQRRSTRGNFLIDQLANQDHVGG